MGNHRHNHGYFGARTVDTKFYMPLVGRLDERVEYLVGGLVEDAGDTEYEDGPCVGEHALEQRSVELPSEAGQLAVEEEGHQC